MKRYGNSFLCIGTALTLLLVLLTLLSIFWTPYDTAEMNPAEKMQPPSMAHIMGTDNFGRSEANGATVGAIKIERR